MVSHLSTTSFLPYIKNYNVVRSNKKTTDSSDSNDTNEPSKNSEDTYQPTNQDNTSCINKFLSSQSPEINISDILKDFKATMTAVAVPRTIGNEIMGELKTVHTQASLDSPQIQTVQVSLKNAANMLDKFISDSLGKNSSVVMHWVDTLLMQKINYKAYDPLPTKVIESEIGNNNLNFEKKSLQAVLSKNDINSKQQTNLKQTNYIETNSAETVKIPRHESVLPDDNAIIENKSKENVNLVNNIIDKTSNSQDITNDKISNKDLYKKYLDLAQHNDNKNKFKEALGYYNKALGLANKQNNSTELAKLHYNIGSIYDDLNMIPQAIDHYNASLGYDGENDNLEGQTLTLNNLGCLYSTTNDYEKALDVYKVAYSLTKQTNNMDAKANILSNLGTTYNNINDYNKALNCLHKSLEIDKKNKNLSGYTKTLVNIGKIYSETGNKTKANNYYQLAISKADSLSDPYLLSIVYEKINN